MRALAGAQNVTVGLALGSQLAPSPAKLQARAPRESWVPELLVLFWNVLILNTCSFSNMCSGQCSRSEIEEETGKF